MSKIRVKCPGCNTLLQLAANLQGSQIRCPKCSKEFLAGNKPAGTPAPRPVATPVKAAPIAAKPVSATPAQRAVPANPATVTPGLVNPGMANSGSAPSGPVNSGLANALDDLDQLLPTPSTPYDAVQGEGYWNAPASPAPLKPKSTKSKRSNREARHEMSDQDQQCMNTSMFMLLIPIVATILPFFGLQLKHLASAGANAPLGAGIFVALIAGGLMVYARRNMGDGVLLGLGIFGASLFFGVGGYVIQKNTIYAEEQSQLADASTDGPGDQSQEANFDQEAHLVTSEELDRQMAESQKMAAEMEQRMEEDQRRMQAEHDERMRQSRERAWETVPPMTDSQSLLPGDSPGAFGNPEREFGMQPFDSGNSRGTPGNFGAQRGMNSPDSDSFDPGGDFGSMNSRGFGTRENENQIEQSSSHSRMQLARATGEASIAYSRAAMRERQFASEYAFVSHVGSKSRTGRLFIVEQPIEAACGYDYIRTFAIAPIGGSDLQFDHRIVPPASNQLVGFNFSLDGGKIVGVQGLFGDFGDSANELETGEWIGVESANTVQSISTEPNCGFVIYADMPDMVGFAWVIKKR